MTKRNNRRRPNKLNRDELKEAGAKARLAALNEEMREADEESLAEIDKVWLEAIEKVFRKYGPKIFNKETTLDDPEYIRTAIARDLKRVAADRANASDRETINRLVKALATETKWGGDNDE
jgi:hypothetical protein